MLRFPRLVVLLIVGMVGAGFAVASDPVGPAVAAGSGYVPLATPTRILDTRPDGATADGQFAQGGQRPTTSTLALTVAGRADVPADAVAVVLNVTVTTANGPGFITAYPCGAAQPTASNLNYIAGRNIPNLVVAKLGTGGQVCLYNTEPVHLIVDVTGYFPGADSYAPLVAPARLLDTRLDGSTVDGVLAQGGILAGGSVQCVQVTGRAEVPSGAATAVLNVTVDGPQASGFVTVFPCGTAIPTASNLNDVANQTIPNAVVAKIGAGGSVCLYTSAATHLIVDIAGYFADQSVVVPLATPARLLDTRADGITFDGAFARGGLRPTGGTLQLSIAGRANVPAGASSVILNVTVDGPQVGGFATVYPTGVGQPNASNLNYIAGQTVPNAVIARLGAGGSVCVFTSGATHLIVDVAGYITGPAPDASGAACPADPVVPTTTAAPATTAPPATNPPATNPPATAPPSGGIDPRYPTCKAAKAAGYGPYVRGVDPEHAWYEDRDHDGIVCE